jgi:hypothetical protein
MVDLTKLCSLAQISRLLIPLNILQTFHREFPLVGLNGALDVGGNNIEIVFDD